MDFSEYRLRDNPGVMRGKLSQDLFDALKSDIEKSKKIAYPKNEDLIGQIEEEFALVIRKEFRSFLISAAEQYQKLFEYELKKKPVIVDHWLNVQKKHEYNPVHHHFNSIAWVVWVNIPYDLNDEMKHVNSKQSSMKRNSVFEFVFSKLGGGIQTHPIFVNKEDEGTIIMFPSDLKHTVYPFFTSDNCRISASGNIDLI